MILRRITGTGGDVQSFMLRNGQEYRLGREDTITAVDDELALLAIEDYPEYLQTEAEAEAVV